MTKIDIISGFLGAGKTTLIKKLIKEALGGQKVVLIENEFGEIGIDGGFLKEAGIEITEMNSGCICCTLVGDFGTALRDVITKYEPDRIIIEPSGVGKLSDVIKAVADVKKDFENVELNSFIAVVDAGKTTMYMKNFGEFFNDQIENANTIVLSRTGKTSEGKIEKAVAAIKEHNNKAVIITTDWDELTGAQILETMEKAAGEVKDLLFTEEELESCEHHHHHEHDHEEGHECGCGHH
ncbi:MAG: CobW family GTP-binding protein, partial [Catonella sp.]